MSGMIGLIIFELKLYCYALAYDAGQEEFF